MSIPSGSPSHSRASASVLAPGRPGRARPRADDSCRSSTACARRARSTNGRDSTWRTQFGLDTQRAVVAARGPLEPGPHGEQVIDGDRPDPRDRRRPAPARPAPARSADRRPRSTPRAIAAADQRGNHRLRDRLDVDRPVEPGAAEDAPRPAPRRRGRQAARAGLARSPPVPAPGRAAWRQSRSRMALPAVPRSRAPDRALRSSTPAAPPRRADRAGSPVGSLREQVAGPTDRCPCGKWWPELQDLDDFAVMPSRAWISSRKTSASSCGYG